MQRTICALFFCLISLPVIAEKDYCQLAWENLNAKEKEIIAFIKVKTSLYALDSVTVETSKNCQSFDKFLFVRRPDFIKTKEGVCAILPSDEIQLNLCALRVKICAAEDNCQSLIIKLFQEGNHYVKAEPFYNEMKFP